MVDVGNWWVNYNKMTILLFYKLHLKLSINICVFILLFDVNIDLFDITVKLLFILKNLLVFIKWFFTQR